ncbi:MAG TPA: hypothetical protein VHJ39_18510 [Solirubrobacteraceae bacterium]|nr:hypothetical protein [Solirubrobacteraceae bacterium]
MPIVTPELPSAAVEAVQQALAATGRFPRRAGGALSLSTPHPVYSVTLERLAAGDRIADAAELVGWRALLEEDERVVAAVELPGRDPGAGGAVVNRGGFVDSTVTTLRIAEGHERAGAERLELRLFRADALYVLALWLHPAEGGDDLFYPLAPAPPPLRAETAYESESFEADVSELARSTAEAYRSAERPDELGG